MTSKELRAKRAKLIKDAQAILNKQKVTGADMAQVDRMLADSDALMVQINRLETVDCLSADMEGEIRAQSYRPGDGRLAIDTERETRIVNVLATQRVKDLSEPDQNYLAASIARDRRIIRAVLASDVASLSDSDQAQFKARFKPMAAGSESTNTAGGYTVAPLFEADLLVALKAWGGVRQAARVITTATGASMPWPTMDDTANVATIMATENTTVGSGTDLVFGRSSLGAWTYVSGVMPVSLELLQDTVFDVDGLIRNALARRFGVGQNVHFTTGTGVGQPAGVVNAATAGIVAAAGNTTTLPNLDSLLDLTYTVDPAYRANASYMACDDVIRQARRFKDSRGVPLWQPSLEEGVPDKFAGYPIIENQSMPVMAANAKSILFGDFSSYIIRDTLGLQVAVLRERFADQLQVAWTAYMRSDGAYLSGSGGSLKYFQNSAT